MSKTPVLPQMVSDDVEFKYTKLGEPVFARLGAEWADAYSSIRPVHWTSTELRAMADFMDQHSEIRLMSDGSGTTEFKPKK